MQVVADNRIEVRGYTCAERGVRVLSCTDPSKKPSKSKTGCNSPLGPCAAAVALSERCGAVAEPTSAAMSAAVALPVLGRLTVHWCGAGGPTCGSSRCRFAGALSSLVVSDMNLHARIWGVGGGGQGVPPGTGYVHAVPDGVALVQSLIKCIALEAIAVH